MNLTAFESKWDGTLPSIGKSWRRNWGRKTVEKYGRELVAMVSAYRRKQGIDKVVLPEPERVPTESSPAKKRPLPSDTKQTSFDMFNKGLTIARIAEERGLTQSTIEGHLTFFVENGKLDINKLLCPEKQRAIAEKLADARYNSLGEIKRELGDDYTYGEIRMMLALRQQPPPDRPG